MISLEKHNGNSNVANDLSQIYVLHVKQKEVNVKVFNMITKNKRG